MVDTSSLFVKGVTSFLVASVAITLFLSLMGCGGGWDPIHGAVLHEDLGEIKRLLNEGVNVNKTDSRGRTPLYWAALVGSREIAEYLISRGAKIEKGASWKDYNTPLHTAASQGHTDVVKLLVAKGANINKRNMNDETPLHRAAWYFRSETVAYLITHGADVKAKDIGSRTPLHVETFGVEAGDNYRKTVELLIAAGAEVDAKADATKGETPLMGACGLCSKEVVELLILKGADVNARNEYGGTPLTYSSGCKNKQEIEEILHKHGARE